MTHRNGALILVLGNKAVRLVQSSWRKMSTKAITSADDNITLSTGVVEKNIETFSRDNIESRGTDRYFIFLFTEEFIQL